MQEANIRLKQGTLEDTNCKIYYSEPLPSAWLIAPLSDHTTVSQQPSWTPGHLIKPKWR